MNEERQNNAKRIRHAIDRTTEGLAWAHENSDPGARAEFLRHLTRLHDIEYAIVALVKFDVSAQEDGSE